MKALLIIDIQADFTGDNAKMPVDKVQAGRMITRINKLLDKIGKLSAIPVYIGNEFRRYSIANLFRHNAAIKGTPGTKQDSRLIIASDYYFPKHRNDAFTNPSLSRFLRENGIHEIYVTGLFAEGCIYGTINGAIKNGYSVNVLTDCLAAKSDKKLNQMISKYRTMDVKCLTTDDLYTTIT